MNNFNVTGDNSLKKIAYR